MPRLDLNMISSLDALLRHRNVTIAAKSLGVSQPSLSAALAKLRRHFGDDLLVRRGGSFELTPLAREIVEPVHNALFHAERVLQARSSFDPEASQRRFRLRVSDYATAVVGGGLLALFNTRAPRASLQLELFGASAVDDLRSVDGVISPSGPAGAMRTELFSDRWVGVTRRGADVPTTGLTKEFLSGRRVIGVFDRPDQRSSLQRRLAQLGLGELTSFSVDSYLAIPYILDRTDEVAFIPERIAHRVAVAFPIQLHESAAISTRFREFFWWDRANDSDPAHRWLRQLVVDSASGLDDDPKPAAESGNDPS